MNVTIPLPTDPLYCPKLSSTVYDYIFRGWNQPMIGVFTIPIGQYMLDLKAERVRETEAIETINDELGKILSGDVMPVQNFDSGRESSGINASLDRKDTVDSRAPAAESNSMV